jgi:hypothetical protein
VPEDNLGEPLLGDCGDSLPVEVSEEWIVGEEWLVGCTEVSGVPGIFAIERSTRERVPEADRSRNVFIGNRLQDGVHKGFRQFQRLHPCFTFYGFFWLGIFRT